MQGSVEFQNTAENHAVVQRHYQRWWHRWMGAAYFALVTLPAIAVNVLFGAPVLWSGAVAGCYALWGWRSFYFPPAATGPFGSAWLRWSEAGLVYGTQHGWNEVPWSCVSSLTEVGALVVLHDELGGCLVPRSAFVSERAADEFVGYVRQRLELRLPFVGTEPPPAFAGESTPADHEVCYVQTRAVAAACRMPPPDAANASAREPVALPGWLIGPPLMCFGVMMQRSVSTVGEQAAVAGIAGGLLTSFGSLVLVGWMCMQLDDWRASPRQLIPRRLRITPRGVHLLTHEWRTFWEWSQLIAGEETQNHVLLRFEAAPPSSLAVPKSAFASPAATGDFLAAARGWSGKAQRPAPEVQPAAPAAPAAKPVETGNPYQSPGSG